MFDRSLAGRAIEANLMPGKCLAAPSSSGLGSLDQSGVSILELDIGHHGDNMAGSLPANLRIRFLYQM